MTRRRGSTRKRGKGTWQLRVTKDGELLERTVPARNAAEADVRLAEFVFELGEPPAASAVSMTVAELAEHWWKIEGRQKEEATRRGYRRDLDRYIIRDLGPFAVADVSAVMLRTWFADLRDGERSLSGEPLSASRLRNIKAPLSGMFGLAADDLHLIPTNFVRALPLPEVPKSNPVDRVPAGFEERFERLLQNVGEENAELARGFYVTAAVGARMGELCALRYSDLDLDAKDPAVTIARTISRRQDGGWFEKDYPKGGWSRRVTIDRPVVEVLRAQRRAMVERALACGVPLPDDAFVFSDAPDGSEWWSARTVWGRWKRAAKAVGMPKARPHDLRHYFCTTLADEGLDIHEIRRAAGHSTIAVTDRYIQGRNASPAVGAAMGRRLKAPTG